LSSRMKRFMMRSMLLIPLDIAPARPPGLTGCRPDRGTGSLGLEVHAFAPWPWARRPRAQGILDQLRENEARSGFGVPRVLSTRRPSGGIGPAGDPMNGPPA